jgi:hypothetical protein
MSDDTELTVEELFDFISDEAESAADEYDGEVPNHAASVLLSRVDDLHTTMRNIEMAEMIDGIDDPTDEEITQSIRDEVVNIVLSIGGLEYEYDLDLATAIDERLELIESVNAFEAAADEADSKEEMMEAMDEHLSDELAEEMQRGDVAIGDNVDADDYEGDQRGFY